MAVSRSTGNVDTNITFHHLNHYNCPSAKCKIVSTPRGGRGGKGGKGGERGGGSQDEGGTAVTFLCGRPKLKLDLLKRKVSALPTSSYTSTTPLASSPTSPAPAAAGGADNLFHNYLIATTTKIWLQPGLLPSTSPTCLLVDSKFLLRLDMFPVLPTNRASRRHVYYTRPRLLYIQSATKGIASSLLLPITIIIIYTEAQYLPISLNTQQISPSTT